MSARDKERYYWLKLDKGFFKRHDMKVLEAMPNGKEYVLFYLKLMLESVDHEGALRFNDFIPYNADMLAAVTNTNIDIVRVAINVLEQYGMLEVFDDKTLYLRHVADLLGSETYAAKRKREQREEGLPGDNVPRLSPACPQEIDTDIEKDKETDIDNTISDEIVCRTKDVRAITKAWNELGLQQITKITADSIRGKMLKARIREHGVDGILTAINNIRESTFLKGDNDKGWEITFEWFVKPNNFIKVLEGNYSAKQEKPKQYTTAAQYSAPGVIDVGLLNKIKDTMGG